MQYKDLNVRQRIGQLFMVTIEGNHMYGSLMNLLTQYHVGGICFTNHNLEHPKQIHRLTNDLQHYSNKALPLFMAVKQVTATKGMTIAPSPRTLGTINNRLYTKQAADIIGKEMKAVGINMNIGPDLHPSKQTIESFSNDITHVSHHGRAMIEGYHKHNILSVAGDFLADYHMIPSERPLYKTGIHPYLYAIEHGLEAIITSNPKLAVPFLRNDIGYSGLIIYDTHNYEDLVGEVIEALENGVDMVSLNCDYKTQLHVMEEVFQAVQHTDLPEPTVNLAVNRIASIKKRFDIDEPHAFNQDVFKDKQASLFMEKLATLFPS